LNTPEGRAQLKRQSPPEFVERIKAPLMVANRAQNNPGAPTEAKAINNCDARSKPAGRMAIIAPDEGHGLGVRSH